MDYWRGEAIGQFRPGGRIDGLAVWEEGCIPFFLAGCEFPHHFVDLCIIPAGKQRASILIPLSSQECSLRVFPWDLGVDVEPETFSRGYRSGRRDEEEMPAGREGVDAEEGAAGGGGEREKVYTDEERRREIKKKERERRRIGRHDIVSMSIP